MRISQPADGGEEDVRIENDAGNLIHDSWRMSSTKASRCVSVIVSQSKLRAEASRRMSFSPSRAVVCHHWSRSAVRSVRTRRLLWGGSCFTNSTTCSSVSDSVAIPVFCPRIIRDSISLFAHLEQERLPPDRMVAMHKQLNHLAASKRVLSHGFHTPASARQSRPCSPTHLSASGLEYIRSPDAGP